MTEFRVEVRQPRVEPPPNSAGRRVERNYLAPWRADKKRVANNERGRFKRGSCQIGMDVARMKLPNLFQPARVDGSDLR